MRMGESGLVPGYFNCTCNICEGALAMYYAGPWEQAYSATYLHDASLFPTGELQWWSCCFWHEGYGYGGDFGPEAF